MRAITPFLAVAAFASSAFSAEVVSTDGKTPADYVPAMISNGRLNVFVEPTLGVARESKSYGKKNLQPGIWWEGRRLVDNKGVASRFGYPLLPQGDFQTVIRADGRDAGGPRAWRQSLDVRQALCTVENDFASGVRLAGETFVPRARDVIAVRQTVTATDGDREIELGLVYAAPRHVRIQGAWSKTAAGAAWKMRTFGRFVTDETIGVEPDGFRPDVAFADGRATLTAKFRLAKGESKTLAWFVTFADDLEKSLPLINPVKKDSGPLPSYAALRERHLADWAAYFAASEIDVPDARLRAMSDMARYHLRCVATEWSIPVGIIQSHWQGKIFAFDEMYAAQGLLSAGQFETARVAADFRAATVKDACVRCNKNPADPFRHVGARWLWEGMEGNTIEGSPIGYWFDHIFHQAAVAQTAWSYYRYTDDREWLRQKGYDVIRECALFFRRLYVQDMPDGTSFVTKCTDLERMGPGHERAFMTTCGVIMTLRVAAEAADLVGADAEMAADFRACADRLVKSLPERDGRYIAYPGCTDESMGTLAGLYPFRTFDRANEKQVKAVRHFLSNGEAFGNMYATGKRICPWYAATMAMASLRAGDAKYPPVRWLQEAHRSAGCWGEYWEINEPGVSQFRPWFMTAAGNCLYAINQLLVADMDGALHLAAGVPDDWKDYSFRLPAPGGITVRMSVKDAKVTGLSLEVRSPSSRKVKIVLPERYGLAPREVELSSGRCELVPCPSAAVRADEGAFGEARRLPNTDRNAMALAIDGDVLYAGAGNTLYTFDLADPLRPTKLGEVNGIGGARQLAVQDGFAYVTTREYGLWIVDCRDPRRPRIRSRFDTCELATGVDVAGDVCFCGQRQNGVEFIDVSDPDEPRHIAMRKTGESQSVVYRDGWLYSGEWGGGFVTVFDAHDMADIRQVALTELYGYGDGLCVQGHYLYAARGHHSLHREVKDGGIVTQEMTTFGGPKAGGGMGHGLDIFDITDPRAPRRVGEVDYPPFYARGLDMWTPRVSGDLLVAAQTHNGLFAVDVSNRSAPRVIGRWVRPSADNPANPSACIGSVAIGDGVVYAAVKGEGFFAIPCARAKREPLDRGVLPKNRDTREAYPTDAKEWHVWKPETVGQVRALAVTGDVVYAACGDAGLHVLEIRPDNGGLREIGRLTGHDKVFDVKVADGMVYAAEGRDGVGVYRLTAAATFDEIARLPKIASGKSLALYVQPAAPGWVFCSDRRGVDLFDVRKLPEMRHVLHTGSCPGWDKYLQDAAVADGRFIAYNNANSFVSWIDLKASPDPVVAAKTTPKNRLPLSSGLCAFRDDLTLAAQGGGYVLLKPGEVDPPDGGKWRRRPLPTPPGWKFDGIPRSDGTRVVFTNRIRRRATLYDFTDAEHPKLLKDWKFSGNPDQAAFHHGKVLVPCGYQGVLLQR